MAELKNCPFCDEGIDLIKYPRLNTWDCSYDVQVECESCGAQGPIENSKDGVESASELAVDAWNERH